MGKSSLYDKKKPNQTLELAGRIGSVTWDFSPVGLAYVEIVRQRDEIGEDLV